jgi:beta-glucosidase
MTKLALPYDSKMLDEEFIFGVATSSFQIEGARATRLDSIWDTFCAQENTISDHTHGDVACDHINRWQEDVQLICDLGVDAYRFSISWPRVMHQDGSVNEVGFAFYEHLVDALKAQGKKVFVTLYHWDLPQYLEDEGGWLNRNTAVEFAKYCDAISARLGSKVDAYTTLNEPFCAGYLSYELGIHAPGLTGKKNGRQASHHLLLAHGLAMQVLRKNCPDADLGIVINIHPGYPQTDSAADIEATKMGGEYLFYWYLDPLLKQCYPSVMDKLTDAEKPDIQDGDMAIIGQPLDFIGMNYYTRNVYTMDDNGWFSIVPPPAGNLTEMGWEIVPGAMTDMLVSLNNEYPLPPMFITENGAAMPDKLVGKQVDDQDRIDYFQSHFLAVHNAMEQGVNIKGYFAWSLLDNFEWAEGYSKRFGLIYIDYETQERIWKDSAIAYKNMLTSRALVTSE